MKVRAKVERAYVVDEQGRSEKKAIGTVFNIKNEAVAEQYIRQGFVVKAKIESSDKKSTKKK